MPKRKLTPAASSAAALTAVAFADEDPVVFDEAHYGPLGLNGRFESTDAIEFFAGGDSGGGGAFEDAEARDLAGAVPELVRILEAHGLVRGATVLDVGAGTGLMLKPLSEAVGAGGRVLAIDLSSRFVAFMRQRVQRNVLTNVRVTRSTARATGLPPGRRNLADLACILDVYHHFQFPRTFMQSVRLALRPRGKVVLVDFWRDPKKMVNHSPSWALEHIRADKAVFVAEVCAAGFAVVDQPVVEGMQENYCVVFEKTAD